MYLATKYAAQVLNISIDALKKSAQRGNNYPFIKYQNKLLFKVSQAQLSIALNKGLIDVNTPIFNDDLTLIQDFFKTNLRRKNGRERNDKTPSKVCKSIREHTIYDDKSAFRCDEKPNSSYQTALFCRLSDSNRQKSVCRTCKNAGDANLANIKHNTQSSTKYKDYERTNECKNARIKPYIK